VTTVVLVVCALWTVTRLAGLDEPWPLPPLLTLTPLLFIPVLGVAFTAALGRDFRILAGALVILVALAIVVLPRAWGAADRRDGALLRVMTVNLRVGGADPATVVKLVRDNGIDLLAVQEYTPGAERALAGAGLDALLPYRVDDPEPLAAGSALYAREPLTGGVTPTGPGGFTQADAVLHLDGAIPVDVRSVHPCAPYLAGHDRCWRDGLAAEPATGDGTPHLLLGDFNASLDHPEFRRLVGSGYRDAASVVGAGLVPTWPADVVPAMTLDHILTDRRIGVRTVSTFDVPDTDHRALAAVLVLPRQ
jgi:endonuclease/exonuclease/phosphatase family metal-dependent hydrolase